MSVRKEGLTINVIDTKDDSREAVPFTVSYDPEWGTVEVYYDDKQLFITDWGSNMFQLLKRAMEIWPCPSSDVTEDTE